MLRPLHDWIVVRVDPLPTEINGIFVPAGGGRVRTATVIAVGPGKRKGAHRTPVGLETGEKVAYLLVNEEHKSGKQIIATLKELGDDLAMVRASDILFAYVGDIKVSH